MLEARLRQVLADRGNHVFGINSHLFTAKIKIEPVGKRIGACKITAAATLVSISLMGSKRFGPPMLELVAGLPPVLGKRNWQLSLATGLYDLRCQPAGGPLAGCHIVFGQEEAAGVVPCRRSISL